MVQIRKRDGKLVPFDPEKIVLSLERTGATKQTITQVLKELEPKLYNGISTKKIYSIVFRLLNKKQRPVASKFGLKEAIARMGPRGHNFETFVARILEEKGYKTSLRQNLRGNYIDHEVDVIAEKGKEKFIAECKFHNQSWIYCPIQDALYTYARFLDIKSNKKNKVTGVMLITNTRFSSEVKKYAKGVELKLLGWKHPKNQSLELIIDKKSIYPITVLQELTEAETGKLLDKGVVVVMDLAKMDEKDIQTILECSKPKAEKVKKEVLELLKPKK